MNFDILGSIHSIDIIAIGSSIRELDRLKKDYGTGIATIRLEDGTVGEAEIHWYEAHGIGKKELKIKYFLGQIL